MYSVELDGITSHQFIELWHERMNNFMYEDEQIDRRTMTVIAETRQAAERLRSYVTRHYPAVVVHVRRAR